MNRLTITLTETRYRALKEASARRGKPIGRLIDESLEFYGIKTHEDALAIFERAGRNSGLTEVKALGLAVSEVRAHRNDKARHR